MTGAYLRVKRDGKWKSVEVEYLTDNERSLLLQNRSAKELFNWIDVLCTTLLRAEEEIRHLEDSIFNEH